MRLRSRTVEPSRIEAHTGRSSSPLPPNLVLIVHPTFGTSRLRLASKVGPGDGLASQDRLVVCVWAGGAPLGYSPCNSKKWCRSLRGVRRVRQRGCTQVAGRSKVGHPTVLANTPRRRNTDFGTGLQMRRAQKA